VNPNVRKEETPKEEERRGEKGGGMVD